MNLLLTGSTGFVGQGLLHYLKYKNFSGTIHLTIRDKKGETAIQRFSKIQTDFPELSLKLCTIAIVDLCNHSIPDIDCIINVAAAIDFNLEIRDALYQNVDGVKSLIQFANRNENVTKFIHISTAYVSDPNQQLIKEEFVNLDKINPDAETIYQQVKSGELSFEQINQLHFFPNTYCATKCIAEKIIEIEIGKQSRVDYSIVRPSIITNAMSIPYNGWFQGYAACIGMQTLILEGYIPYIIGNKTTQTNIVPIDYVCSVIYDTIYINKIHIQHAVIENTIKIDELTNIYSQYYTIFLYAISFATFSSKILYYTRQLFLCIQYYLCFNQKTRLQLKTLYTILKNIDVTFYTFFTNTFNFQVKRPCNSIRKLNTRQYLMSTLNALVYKRRLFHLQDPTKQSYTQTAYNIFVKYFTFNYTNNVYYGILLFYAIITQFILNRLYKNIIVEIEDIDKCTFQTKPTLVVSNHNSHLDTAILKYLFLSHTHLKLYNPIVIATDEFQKIDNPRIKQMLANTNIKYISRTNFDKDEFIRFLKTEVKSNTNIILFPEGTRSRDRTIGQLKSGIYDLMNKYIDFQVLPVSITYSCVPETNGFIESYVYPNKTRTTKLMSGVGLSSLFKLLFAKRSDEMCCIKLGEVIQAPASISDIESIIIQNHHYLQKKYYKQLKMDCDDQVKRYFNHTQFMKFHNNTLAYDGLNYPVPIDENRILYTERRDKIIQEYKLDIPLRLGDYKHSSNYTMPSTKYVLITGGTGLIGSNLLRSIVSSNKIGNYIILSRSIAKNLVTTIGNCTIHTMKGDITNIDAVEDYDFKLWNLSEIYHFAGQVSHHKNINLIKNMIDANRNGTHNICKLIQMNLKIHKKKINVTYMSTSGVVLKEARQFPYYQSKIEAEEYILQHAKTHGYNLTIFRPSMVIGEVDIELLKQLNIKISEPKENFFRKVKNGHLKFCMDTCTNAIACEELIQCVMTSKYKKVQIFNCSGQNYKLIDIFKYYRQTDYTYLNPLVMKTLLFVTDHVNIMPSLHYYMRMAQYDWSIDSTITKNELGFAPKNLLV